MSTLERAIEIAAKAHTGMVDKAGEPYILHPLRVMLSVQNNDERIVAVLHDVIEDSNWTQDDLRKEGFSEKVLEGISAVTRIENETYDGFINRAATNSIGILVKLADLKDNMDLSRIESPVEKDFVRLEKYRRATEHLLSITGKERSL